MMPVLSVLGLFGCARDRRLFASIMLLNNGSDPPDCLQHPSLRSQAEGHPRRLRWSAQAWRDVSRPWSTVCSLTPALPTVLLRARSDTKVSPLLSGSGCSSFLQNIANQRESFLEVTGDVRYAGIDAAEMRKDYPGEVVYNQEGELASLTPLVPGLYFILTCACFTGQTMSTFPRSLSARPSALRSRPKPPASVFLAHQSRSSVSR